PPFRFGRDAAVVDCQPSMCARSDSCVVMSAPVNQIVPALSAAPRMIGNLVGWQAGIGANGLREIIEIAREILVRNGELARPVQAEERRVRFDGQLIEREMFGGFGDRALEFRLPAVKRLPGPRVDQIERVAVKYRASDGNRVERFLRGVQTA